MCRVTCGGKVCRASLTMCSCVYNDRIEGMAAEIGDKIIVFRSTSESDCRERALVLAVAGIASEIRRDGGGLVLAVAVADAAQSRAEFEAYERENPNHPLILHPAPSLVRGWPGVLVFAALLVLAAVLQWRQACDVDWFDIGKTSAGLIRQGQWWRAVTAMTLHADAPHLAANVLVGGLAGLFAGQTLGSGIAWFFILIGGALGNLLNAGVRPAAHSSIGASTAVFAGLGLLAALAWRRRAGLPASSMQRWAPLIGGVLLLSFLGTGGGRTDVAAHVFGFASGVLLGFVSARWGERAAPSQGVQLGFGLGTLAIVAGVWALAMCNVHVSLG